MFDKAEYLVYLEYGADVHGVYSLFGKTNAGKIWTVGNQDLHRREMRISWGKGVVGIFGAYTDVIVHIGFFFDEIRDLNF